jgi:hypothetical protein
MQCPKKVPLSDDVSMVLQLPSSACVHLLVFNHHHATAQLSLNVQY